MSSQGVAELIVETLKKHDGLYFDEHTTEISDQEYDELVSHLEKLDPKNPYLHQVRDSTDFKKFSKTTREIPMLSLKKCSSQKDLRDWSEKINGTICIMPKIDGCSIEITYDANGKMSLASTRGDGYTGEVVTQNAQMVDGIPSRIGLPSVVLRGEVFMKRSVYDAFPEGKFSNPRNAAAGGLRQKDANVTRDYNLSFLAFDVIFSEPNDTISSEQEKFSVLEVLKVPSVPVKFVEGRDLQVESVLEFGLFEKGDCETDGIVFKCAELAKQKKMGFTNHHPRYAIAYKWGDEVFQTKMLGVDWEVSRSGRINPVARFKPVDVGAAVVRQASVHSDKHIKKLSLYNEATIEISRRGGVIPQIERVVQHAGKAVEPPVMCPGCGGQTVFLGEFLYCADKEECVSSGYKFLASFADIFKIQGLGEKTIETLYKLGLISTPRDFYRLRFEDLKEIGFGVKTTNNILKAIEDSKTGSVPLLLSSMNIQGLGVSTAKLLWDQFGEFIFNVHAEDMQGVDGIGEKKARDIYQGIRNKKEDIAYIMALLEDSSPRGDKLSGLSFCFTGSLSRKRSELEKTVLELGGEISDVSSKLSYLVAGESKAGLQSSKIRKAAKLEVAIINEKKFIEIIGE